MWIWRRSRTHGQAGRVGSTSWADADPHLAEFRRWVPGTPGLPEGANALFKAREKALKKQGDAEDARELRKELARLGVVVRDEDRRQCWRLPSQ